MPSDSTTPVPTGLGLSRRPLVASLASWLGAAAIITIATAIAMWPALAHSSTTVMGDIQPNDATTGGVWLAWQLQSLSPFAAHTPALNAPVGVALWAPPNVTEIAWILPLWIAAHLSTPTGAWDYTTALGFLFDGLAMFGLVRWLTGRWWIAVVGAILYAFSPFHVEESYAHIGYVYSGIFPLIVWAGLALGVKPTVRRGLLFGTLTGLAAYCDGYYLVFAPLLGAILGICCIAWWQVHGGWKRFLRPLSASVGAYLLCVLPVVVVVLSAGSKYVSTALGRTQATVEFYSAQPWQYVVPWTQSVIWRSWSYPAAQSLLGSGRGSGVLERSLYLGFVVMLLAIAFWIVLARSKAADETQPGIPLRFVGWSLLAVTLVTLLCSFATFGPIPGFPLVVWRIFPYWRVYTRLFVAVDVGAVAAACLLLQRLWDLGLARMRQRSAGWRPNRLLLLVAPALAALALVDATAIVPSSTWSYTNNTADSYGYLRHHPGGIVAEYPPIRPPKWEYEYYLTYQSFYRHRLFYLAPAGSFMDGVERGTADIDDPQTLPALAHYGVRYVVVHGKFYSSHPSPLGQYVHLPGLRLIITGNFVTLYRLVAVRPSIGMITIGSGFNPEEAALPHILRWTSSPVAYLGILPFSHWANANASFEVRSNRETRMLTVSQSGHLLWRGQIPAGHAVRVTCRVNPSIPLTLRTTPGPTLAPGYATPHYFGVDVYDLVLNR